MPNDVPQCYSFRPVGIDEVQPFWGDVLGVLEEATTLNLVFIHRDGFRLEVYPGPFGPDPPIRNGIIITNGFRVHELDRFDELDEVLHFLRKLRVLRRAFLRWDQSTERVQMLQGRRGNCWSGIRGQEFVDGPRRANWDSILARFDVRT